MMRSICHLNNSIVYIDWIDDKLFCTVYYGTKHKTFDVNNGDTDISLGSIDGEVFHLNLNNGMNEVYGHYPDGRIRTLSRQSQNFVLDKLLE